MVDYSYTGSAHTELAASYEADDPRFRTHESPNFPERNTVISETRLLRKLLFPGCWNGDDLVGDEAAANLLRVLHELEPAQSGGFFDETGVAIPY